MRVTASDPHTTVRRSRLANMAVSEQPRDPRDEARAEIREFLSTRRARITPQEAGLPNYGGDRRRVAGLRREEVALLAGVSPQYYIRLERGDATGVSESVIDSIAQALRLDEAEHAHLLDLIRTASTPRHADAADRTATRPPHDPAAGRLDARSRPPSSSTAARHRHRQHLGRALFSPVYDGPRRAPEQRAVRLPRPTRQDASSANGTRSPSDTVAILRAEAGARPRRPRPLRPDRATVHPQ